MVSMFRETWNDGAAGKLLAILLVLAAVAGASQVGSVAYLVMFVSTR